MLDDINVVRQRDPSGALDAVAGLPDQTVFEPELVGHTDTTDIQHVVIAGMGGSALAADMIKVLSGDQFAVPFDIVKGYDLPRYVGSQTLVIALSHSGNTEETLTAYTQARERGAMMAAAATGGALLERAAQDGILHARVPSGAQPRMSTVYHLRIVLKLLQHFNLIDDTLYGEVADSAEWLRDKIGEWLPDVPTEHNYAKQLASDAVGKTAVFYGGQLTAPMAYKWKISFNESSKNVAFWNQYPEFNHNELIGWTSHPVEKPYWVLDIRSHFERERVTERMELTDRLLSGMRPKARPLQLIGENLTRQFLWGLALADLTSIYLAVLNNVDPTPVALVEKFKAELS